MAKRSSIDHQTWWKNLKNHRYLRIFIFVFLGIFTYGMLVSNVIPETLEVDQGTVSDQDIRSPLTIENKLETERLQQEASEAVEPVYSKKTRYAQNQLERIQDIFHSVEQVQNQIDEKMTEIEEKTTNSNEDDMALEEISDSEQLDLLEELLPAETIEQVSDDAFLTLLETTDENLETAQETTTSAVYDVMEEEIPMDEVDDAKERVESKVAIATVSPDLLEAMIEISRFGITANYMMDEDATQEARESAIEAVEPVMIREGQLLVEEGQVITGEIYQQLSLVGLTEEVPLYYPYVGLAIIISLLIAMLAYYLNDAKTSLQTNNTHLLMYSTIYMLSLILLKLVSLTYVIDLNGITFLAPVAMGTMLLTTLLQSRVAIFTSMTFAIIASIMFNGESSGIVNYTHGIYIFFSGLAGVFFLSKSQRMMRMLQTGIFVSFINILVVIAILLLKNAQYGWFDIGTNVGFAFLSGFISVVLAIGLLPFFEAGFGVLSPTKLIELSNPNHPLLRKILLEAPGTYHHSVVVANLAEAACESVGANGLLARVGSYYHDIGKTRRPHFFIENQMKIENPHDNMSPHLSKTIIISHPYDGADMLKSHKLPKAIVDIAEQHHGTSLLKYFYHKAKQTDAKEEIEEEEFRYPGPKAQSKEAALVGFADCVEAAVRSMQHPTTEKIESLVRKILLDRLTDGQFDDCDLTLKELNKAAISMCETLQGTFHSRIEYPEDDLSKKEDNV
ncbi:HD family phosphohydrolase [Salipaludibacillus sp. LMS25]|jgi:putative nucleotidyltransferase with HDIG domain|uniref:HD family phosphohydrolase n=1 Tax=Salipaludibacillus sp. LMS25 TaxID=2924031 RepID=UPI0020D05E51|nr:HD family phosphohydrolase [Salipaludibacillus sp. LMS25]UTR14377.1 HD family phosphohydrolase [Salipaludibacillus sp. LMS25]